MSTLQRNGWRFDSAVRDALVVAGCALVARLGVVGWAARQIPPTADGNFYHVIATRISRGLGYTWLWPDGAVTFAAHYPVGYPAMIGGAYSLFGPYPVVAMTLHAVLGTLAACAVHALARRATTPRRALVVGLLAATHVGLVAYTPALMTEGVTASLCAVGTYAAMKARESQPPRHWWWLAAPAMAIGLCGLVRPQSLVLAPVLGWLAVRPTTRLLLRLTTAVGIAALALAVCLPWMIRNHVRMGYIALSFNGGWNLLIGTNAAGGGTWAPLEVPPGCETVFDEARKDICFGHAAFSRIAAHPWQWLALVPKKLAATFDYCGGAGWYLHAANPAAFSATAKLWLGIVETAFERLVLGAALVWSGLAAGPRRRLRCVVALAVIVFLLTPHAYVAYLGLCVVLALLGRVLVRSALVAPAALAVVASTAAFHAIFFGAGRYSMVVFPFVTALAGGLLTRNGERGDTRGFEGDVTDAVD